MKTLKIMSTISIIINIFIIFILTNVENVIEAVAAIVVLLIILLSWSILFSIIALVISLKTPNMRTIISQPDYNSELLKLHELKEKSILTESEFNEKKVQILYILRKDLRNFNS